MKTRNLIISLAAAGLLGVTGYGLYRAGMDRGMKTAAPAGGAKSAGGNSQPAGSTDKKVRYWHDPMVPGQKFDKPGKSPFMDMQLVPVYADGEGDEGKVTISPRMQQNLGVRTAEVVTGKLASEVQAVGSVAYNERDVAVVQARSNGFVEKLYVRAPLDPVRKGQALAELYVPDWVAAQEEYLSARRIGETGLAEVMAGLLDGARQRMRLAGMTEDQIHLVESTGQVHARFVVSAPISGVIAELGAREGMTVMAGGALFRINGLDTVWVNAEVPENRMALVRPGNPVTAVSPALPGAIFKGKLNALLPEVNVSTRTIKARIELANPNNQLVPGMFVTVNLSPVVRKETLLVPAEAVIRTGTRSVVIVAQGDGRFVPTDVEIGSEAEGRTEIRNGLKAGEKVVVSGQFLIDSEASLKGTFTRMGDTPVAASEGGSQTHHGEGKVEKIGEREITLSHGPIASLQWGAMTMAFRVKDPSLLSGLKPGQNIEFEFTQVGNDYVVSRITPQPSAVRGK